MIEQALLVASFLVFLAIAIYAKVRSKLGVFIVLTGLLLGLINVVYVLLQML